jgi:hypothetical protein
MYEQKHYRKFVDMTIKLTRDSKLQPKLIHMISSIISQYFDGNKGDQIRRIFAIWRLLMYFGLFLISKVSQILCVLFSTKTVMYLF